jgi:hypothetical protein
VTAGVLPKEMEITRSSPIGELSDDELAALIEQLRSIPHIPLPHIPNPFGR